MTKCFHGNTSSAHHRPTWLCWWVLVLVELIMDYWSLCRLKPKVASFTIIRPHER
jgi:hypothetical protein